MTKKLVKLDLGKDRRKFTSHPVYLNNGRLTKKISFMILDKYPKLCVFSVWQSDKINNDKIGFITAAKNFTKCLQHFVKWKFEKNKHV